MSDYSGLTATPIYVVPLSETKKGGDPNGWSISGFPAIPVLGATAETIDSNGATAGQVLTADGTGGVSWEDEGGGAEVQLLETPPDGATWIAEVVADLGAITPNVATEVDLSAYLNNATLAFIVLSSADIVGSGAGAVEFRPATTSSPLRITVTTSSMNTETPITLPVINDAFYITIDDGGGAAGIVGKIFLLGGL